MPTHYVYILRCRNGACYTGYTTDLAGRIEKHRAGLGGKFTRAFGVEALLHCETYATKSEALRREAEIKSWPRAKKMELVQSGMTARGGRSARSPRPSRLAQTPKT